MKSEGFSLMELNVCCAVITILCVIAFPLFGGIQNSALLKKEVRALYGNLQKAKGEAIKRNNYVVFQADEQGYVIFADDGSGAGIRGDWVRQPGEKIIAAHKYPEKINMRRCTFVNDRTRFNGNVIGVNAGRVVLEHSAGGVYEVVVSILGRIRADRKS